MSEFYPRAVLVTKIEKHPNADTLSIVDVEGYPVIVRTGEFKEGDLAAYIPIDSIMPDKEQWDFLGKHRRIKAKKLRGIFSMGMLAPLPPGEWKVGDALKDALGIIKYEPGAEREIPENPHKLPPKPKGWGPIAVLKRIYYYFKYGRNFRKKSGTPPFTFPEYTDIEGLRKYKRVLMEGEEVVIGEKVHGSNSAYTFYKNKFWVRSHHQFKGRPSKKGSVDNFWQAAFNANLEEKLTKAPGIAFYGEVYGKVQKGFPYDKPGDVRVRFFDAMDLTTLKYLDYEDFKNWCNILDLEVVPVLYKGPWKEELKSLAEGQSILAKHIREGFVVKPIKERIEPHFGRVILKMVGEAYLLSKDS
jgi:hypothetical protein